MLEFAGLGVSVSCGSTTFGATEASTVERYDSAGDLRSARRGDVFFSADSAFAAGISTFIFAVSAEVKEAAAGRAFHLADLFFQLAVFRADCAYNYRVVFNL